jgi:benzoyl-CoA reductase/2-hydroxyglutaryl-CoA dehydratase subunit BcrC/BadD/HgdB
MVKEHDARGVVLLGMKFCESIPSGFALVRETLQKSGVPSVLVDIDRDMPLEGGTEERLRGFLAGI